MEAKYVKIPFEVEMAKRIQNGECEGKIVTRDDKSVRIVCFDAKRDDSIVALISYDNIEQVKSYAKDGMVFQEGTSPIDLMLEVPVYMAFNDGDIIAFGESPIFIGILKDNWPHSRCHTDYVVLNDVGELIYVENYWTYENARIATEEERQKLINALKSSKEPQAKVYLKRFFSIEEKPKCEFKPFDKVVVRDADGVWFADIFSHYSNSSEYKYKTVGAGSWECCIPYNEETAHLLGTTENYE